jgi:multidrug transporter EmrE-like cation transporter
VKPVRSGEMKTRPEAIVAVLLCTIITSMAQIFYKLGANRLTLTVEGILLNYPMIIGLVLYGIGAIVLIISLRYGELTVLYPLIASGYVWVNILSWYIFKEPLTTGKWVGIGIIILGMFFVGAGSGVKLRRSSA